MRTGDCGTASVSWKPTSFNARTAGDTSGERFPGILPCQRSTEAFQRMIFRQHLDGINRSRLGRREGIGAATVERYFQRGLQRQFGEWHSARCPQVLGIDEHFFTRRCGYATTLCDLRNHKVYDVVLGRIRALSGGLFSALEGKAEVRVVCMDLAANYRSLVRMHFPNARIVADRFHVIRIINHHFLACWRDIDGVGSEESRTALLDAPPSSQSPSRSAASPGRLSGRASGAGDHLPLQTAAVLLAAEKAPHPQTMRATHPSLPARRLPTATGRPRTTGPARTDSRSWSEEIVAMWRFTRNNGITEGFHNKMELINRQAYGFRNFQNYRLRVKVLCS